MNALAFLVLVFVIGCNSGATRDDTVAWGKQQNGLRIRCQVNQQSTDNSNAVMLTVSFCNVSPVPISLWQSGFWPNTQVKILDSQMNPAPLTVKGAEYQKFFNPGGERLKNFKLLLKSNEIYQSAPIDLRQYFILNSGNIYSFQVVYEERQKDGWAGRVSSYPIRKRVN